MQLINYQLSYYQLLRQLLHHIKYETSIQLYYIPAGQWCQPIISLDRGGYISKLMVEFV